MAEKRATLILSGEVQDAGFRGKVMRIAQNLGLVGYVENLPNGTVRVVCEGSEAVIQEFSGKLDIHEEYIDVESIDMEFSDATGEFEYFQVKFSDLGMEMFQGFATAGKMLGDVRNEVKASRKDIQAMHTDLKGGFEETNAGLTRVENAVSSMHADMNTRFDSLDAKYGEIGKDMKALRSDITDMKVLATEFREFKDLFAIYVKHQLEKDGQ